jgi:tRNA threonylcarbamoyl adenosine modification protein (Sua5/YciO/YrdC/YwlC family)
MAQLLTVHPLNPQLRLLRQAAQIIDHGGLAAVPTDSCYALVCHLDDKPAVDRLRRIRQIDERHHLTLMCRDLSEIANYARVDNLQYRLLKNATPGPYTFILEATKEVPRRLSHPSRKTIGIRVPEHPVTLGLLDVFGQPLISTTLQLPGDEIPLNDAAHIVERIGHELDVIIDGGACGIEPTTIVDVTGKEAVVVRRGRGPVEALGLGGEEG